MISIFVAYLQNEVLHSRRCAEGTLKCYMLVLPICNCSSKYYIIIINIDFLVNFYSNLFFVIAIQTLIKN
jgi:hypothetical protein